MLFYPFTSTGKERDAETGYSYFGARYYDSDLSGLFLSVDPMSDKYPSLSPYVYCAWNPVKLVDPDGRELFENLTKYYNSNGELLYETKDGLDEIVIVNSEEVNGLLNDLEQLNKNGLLNDRVSNKKLHSKYGGTLKQQQNRKCGIDNTAISDSWSLSYIDGYNDAFQGNVPKILLKIACFSIAIQGQEDNQCMSQSMLSALGVETGPNMAEMNSGYICGITEGYSSMKRGENNIFKPNLKNNKPLFNIVDCSRVPFY